MDFEEFCLLMEKKIAQETQSEVLDLFRVWDLSGEGIIESGELRCLLDRIPERLTRKEIDLLVKQADKKKNGKINFEGEVLLFLVPQRLSIATFVLNWLYLLHFVFLYVIITF